MTEGFRNMYDGNFVAALGFFGKAVASDPKSVVAANNYALCTLYTGTTDLYSVTQSIAALEGFIKTDPAANLHPAVCANLVTMYELASDERTTVRRKKALHELVLKYRGDDFPMKCLKLPTSTS